ncbi:MAG: hypothetical protein IH627_00310 [Rubrivivax sp.]|nr:hypothetical protein [Rubrivivax sp.]
MKIVFDFAGVLFHWPPPAMPQREIPHLARDGVFPARVHANKPAAAIV